MQEKLGLSLTGGGARGAYQAGVIQGISDILKLNGLEVDFPFQVFAGISAGSINAAFCASSTKNFSETASDLCRLWRSITPQEVYRTDLLSIGRISFEWLGELSLGGIFRRKHLIELLDPSPLKGFLNKHIDFANIDKNIKRKKLHALACTAFNYSEHKSNIFIQSDKNCNVWSKLRRRSEETIIDARHLMASSGIPVIFPAVKIKNHYYGDGSLRNTAPLSPLVHLGVNRAIIVDVEYSLGKETVHNLSPSMANIVGTSLNSLFFDTLDNDIERLGQINNIIKGDQFRRKVLNLREIPIIVIRPSKDPAKIFSESSPKGLPILINHLLKGLGDPYQSAELASYLMFESGFCGKLVDLGHKDALSKEFEICEFFNFQQSKQSQMDVGEV